MELQKLLAQDGVLVSAYTASVPGVYTQVKEWPSSNVLWLDKDKIFGWWWVGDDHPHAFAIGNVDYSDDDSITMFYAGGKIVLGELWNTRQHQLVEMWRKMRPPAAQQAVDELAAEVRDSDRVPAAAMSIRTFSALAEMRHVTNGDTFSWAVVGAWAANEQEIAYAPLPQYVPFGNGLQTMVDEAVSDGNTPLHMLTYLREHFNGMTTLRSDLGQVTAATAQAAAQLALQTALGLEAANASANNPPPNAA
jgi:hypothetical protein